MESMVCQQGSYFRETFGSSFRENVRPSVRPSVRIRRLSPPTPSTAHDYVGVTQGSTGGQASAQGHVHVSRWL